MADGLHSVMAAGLLRHPQGAVGSWLRRLCGAPYPCRVTLTSAGWRHRVLGATVLSSGGLRVGRQKIRGRCCRGYVELIHEREESVVLARPGGEQ